MLFNNHSDLQTDLFKKILTALHYKFNIRSSCFFHFFCIILIYQKVYFEPVCDCTCLHNLFAVNASNRITAFVSIEIERVPHVTLACFTFVLINKCPNDTEESAFCQREKNSKREGGVEERYFEILLEVMWYFH